MQANILKSVSGILSADQIQKKVDKVEETDKKNTDRLVNAMHNLTKTLVKIEKDSLKQTGKDRPTISGLINQAKLAKEKFTTKAGIVGMLADKVADRPILGAVMGSVAAHLENKSSNKAREESFVSVVSKQTKLGRDLIADKGEAGAAKELASIYKEKSKLENIVEAKKAKQSAIKAEGKEHGVNADLLPEELKELQDNEEKLKKIVSFINEGMKQSPDKTDPESEKSKEGHDSQVLMSDEEAKQLREELIQSIMDGMHAGYDELSAEEKAALEKEDPEKIKGIREGIEKEVLSLSKQQLHELMKISSELDHDEDAQKEAEIESKNKLLQPIQKENTPKEEKKGFFNSILGSFDKMFSPLKNVIGIFSSLSGMMGRFIPMVGSLLSGLAPILGPMAAVAAAGAGGAMIGNAINDAVESQTGVSVGTHAGDMIDSFKGSSIGNMLGFQQEDQQQKEQEQKGAEDSYNKKLKDGKQISEYQAKYYSEHGIKVDPALITKDKAPIEKQVKDKAPIEKQVTDEAPNKLEKEAYMERATDAVVQLDEENEKADKKSTQPVVSGPTVVNAQKTFNNTTQNIVRPQIRNPEPQYIRVESRRFAF